MMTTKRRTAIFMAAPLFLLPLVPGGVAVVKSFFHDMFHPPARASEAPATTAPVISTADGTKVVIVNTPALAHEDQVRECMANAPSLGHTIGDCGTPDGLKAILIDIAAMRVSDKLSLEQADSYRMCTGSASKGEDLNGRCGAVGELAGVKPGEVDPKVAQAPKKK